MEKKNLIQRIRANAGSFILGATLATGITYIAKDRPVQQPIEQTQKIGYWDHKVGNWFPPEAAIYRLHRDPVDRSLNRGYIEVDRDGDGEYDQIIKFWHKTPPEENPKFWTPSKIELYERCNCGNDDLLIEGFPAYTVIGSLVNTYEYERGISNEQFKKNAQRFFEHNGLDSRVLQNESF